MTDQTSQEGVAPLPAADDAMLAQYRHMLRLALGTTLSLTTAEMLDWELSFLITVLLIQLLASPSRAPGLRQGISIIVVLWLTTGAAATLSTLLVDMPALLPDGSISELSVSPVIARRRTGEHEDLHGASPEAVARQETKTVKAVIAKPVEVEEEEQ